MHVLCLEAELWDASGMRQGRRACAVGAPQDGVLSETATRVLATAGSFSGTNAQGAAHAAALQRIGSFSPAGADLAAAVQAAADAGPWRPAAAVCDTAGERGGASEAAAAAVPPESSPRAAGEAGDGAETGGWSEASTQASAGAAEPAARLRGGAGSEAAVVGRPSGSPAGSGVDRIAATAAAEFGPDAGPAKPQAVNQPPALDSSSTDPEAQDSDGGDAPRAGSLGGKHAPGFLQQFSPLRLIRRLNRGSAAGSGDADVQAAGASEAEMRHKQVSPRLSTASPRLSLPSCLPGRIGCGAAALPGAQGCHAPPPSPIKCSCYAA